jgi:peptidyl-tRNA hydrolase
MNSITYIVVNKDLEMSAGKVAAQVAHAVLQNSTLDDLNTYHRGVERTVIVLEADTEQIRNLDEYLGERNIQAKYVIDEGVNEISPMSITALAVSPFEFDDTEKREIFKGFRLYSQSIPNRNLANHLRYVNYSHTPRFVKKTIDWLNRQ